LRWPNVPIIFTETRQLAEEWTYQYPRRRAHLGDHGTLGTRSHWPTPWGSRHSAARTRTVHRRGARLGPRKGVDVPHRGRLRAEIWQAWRAANDHE
jgi:hypothetical protein